jgi:hypothetical protein
MEDLIEELLKIIDDVKKEHELNEKEKEEQDQEKQPVIVVVR